MSTGRGPRARPLLLMIDPRPTASDRAASRTPSLVVGVLAIAAAVSTNPLALAPLLAEDGRIDEPWVRLGLIAVELALFVLGTHCLWSGRPRRLGVPGLAGAGALGLLVVTGVLGLLHGARPAPWEAPGLPMTERLALLAERSPEVYFYGPDTAELEAELERARSEGGLRALELERQLADVHVRRGEFERAVARLERVLARLEQVESPRTAAFRSDVEDLLIAAWLRWGEVENCAANHNADSCLLPLAGGGVHANPRGVRAARAVLERKLARDADDLLSRWLLNVAAMAEGDWPAGVSAEHRIAAEIFASEVPFPRFHDVAPALGLAANGLAGGSVLEDLDGDGDLDLVASGMGRDDPLRLFVNGGDGTFAERTREAGLAGLTGGLNLCQADHDDDGDVDLLVLRGAWKGPTGGLPNSLLANAGDATFTDVTEEAGLLATHATSSAAWGDLDGDGLLDLFVGNESRDWHPHPSRLFRNSGGGRFEDVIAPSGVALHGFVKGCALGDPDDDGDLDLYVSRRYRANSLYRNDGGFRFTDVTDEAGLGEEFQSFACWFFDQDEDGHQDLFVAGFAGSFLDDEEGGLVDIPAVRLGEEPARDGWPRLYRNRGDGTFRDVAEELGLHRVILVMGANFGDVDNDGWLDLYLGTGKPDFRGLMANRLFRNDRGRRYQDVTTAGGFGHLQKGHGISFGDIDNDGDQDVYAVLGGAYPSDAFPNALFLNPGNANRWITLRFVGERSNRFGVGARITVRVETPAGARTIHRTVGTGGSFGSSSLQQEIGLGDALGTVDVDVAWPSGERSRFSELAPDRVYRLVEGAPTAEHVPVTPIHLRTDTQGHHSH